MFSNQRDEHSKLHPRPLVNSPRTKLRLPGRRSIDSDPYPSTLTDNPCQPGETPVDRVQDTHLGQTTKITGESASGSLTSGDLGRAEPTATQKTSSVDDFYSEVKPEVVQFEQDFKSTKSPDPDGQQGQPSN